MSRLDELIAELCPDGVEYKKLKDVISVERGKRVVREQLPSNGKYFVYQNSLTPLGYSNEYNYPHDTTFIIGAGAAGEIGFSCEDFWAADDCYPLVCSEKYTARFLYHLMLSRKSYVSSQVRKGSIPRLSRLVIENMRIPVPPLPVQQEIVRILDHFTELTAELQKQLDAELTARKKQYEYYLSREFTVLNAPIHKIGEITNVFSAARVHKNEWKTEGVPFFRSSDVISSFGGVENSRGKAFISFELYEKLSAKSGKVKKGDMLITGGGTIGIPYLVPNDEPLYMKDADLLCIQKNDSVLSEFLYFYFLTPQFRDYLANITHDATIPHYTIEQIKKTPIPVPSRNEQEKIVNTISRFFDLCNDLTSGLPAEIAARQKQYEYYRDKLLSFPEKG